MNSSPIFMLQLLCPSRHTILALMFDPYEHSQLAAIELLEDRRRAMKLNPWCGICGSSALEYEARPTKFRVFNDAVAAARMLEAENIVSRLELDEQKLTYDSQRMGGASHDEDTSSPR